MNSIVLKRLHSTEIELLNELDRVARELSVTYYLVGGTLLGAVRHKGFIPWDDDLDVAMPRKDYERFLKDAPELLGERFFLQSFYSDKGFGNLYAKLKMNGTAFIEESSQASSMNQGIFIDIFVLDEGPAKQTPIDKFRYQLARSMSSYLYNTRYHLPIHVATAIYRLIPEERLAHMRDSLLMGKGDCYLNHGSQYGLVKQTIEKSRYDPPTFLEFEGRKYPVPRDYEYVLRRLYGDHYMELPPVEKRRTHDPVRLSFDTSGPDERMDD